MENQLQETLNQFMSTILGGLLSIASAYVILWVNKATQKARIETAKMEDERGQAVFENAVHRTEALIQTNIIAFENTIKKELIESAKDGQVDKNELKKLAVSVRQNVLKQLSDGTINILNDGIKDISSYLDVKIEEELVKVKQLV